MPSADFGPLIHPVAVDRAVIASLMKWLPTYLAQTERREGLASRFLARPKSYANVFDEDNEQSFADRNLPTVLVTTSQADDVEQSDDFYYHAWWRASVSALIRGRHPGDARLNASLYIASIRDLLTDKQSLDGFANGVRWMPGERVRPVEVPSNDRRHLAAGMGEFLLYVPRVGRAYGGPADPEPQSDPDAVYEPPPTVQVVTVGVLGETPNSSEGS
jgi:hypothetical protein